MEKKREEKMKREKRHRGGPVHILRRLDIQERGERKRRCDLREKDRDRKI